MGASPSPKPNEGKVFPGGAQVIREQAVPPPHVHPPQCCYRGRGDCCAVRVEEAEGSGEAPWVESPGERASVGVIDWSGEVSGSGRVSEFFTGNEGKEGGCMCLMDGLVLDALLEGGWGAKSGCRIVGRGWANNTTGGPTILQLEGHDAADDVVIGTGDFLAGFEVSDLLIDCALPNTGTVGAAAININGCNIRVHNLRIVNFGGRGVACDVVTVARPTVGQDVYNCLVSECVIESPSGNSNGAVTCLRLLSVPSGASEEMHRSCVLRDNMIDCGTNGLSGDFRAISASGGVGTIIEGNRVWNCRRGFYIPIVATNKDHSTRDLILRDNFFFNVEEGINLEMDKDYLYLRTVGRVIIEGNVIELRTSVGVATAIRINGEDFSTKLFKQVVIRKNQVRHNDGAAGQSNAIGIELDCIENGIVAENLINIGPNPTNPATLTQAIRRSASASIKTFNNQTTAGVFLPCSYPTPTPNRFDPDLVTDAQDWLLAV